MLIMKIVPEKFKNPNNKVKMIIIKILVGILAGILTFIIIFLIMYSVYLIIQSVYGYVPDWMLSFGI